MTKTFLTIIAVLAIASCARVQTLNLVKHEYSDRPKHIIWFQIAGFSEEHLPLLRFNVPEESYHTSFEKIDCLGKMWSFNLYDLRPDSSKSFLSQLNGSKNIKGRCDDFQSRPIWDYLKDFGYNSSILETGANEEQTLLKSLQCKPQETLDVSKIRYYGMSGDSLTPSVKKYFHYQNSIAGTMEVMVPGIYYDKSCQKNICYSSLSNNFKTLWAQFTKTNNQTFFLVRDFNFIKALRSKDIVTAKESLQEIDRILTWVNSQKSDEILILITGSESLHLEFPKEGKEWAEFEHSGKNILFRNSSLMSPVLAKGPMSENFCGLFDESEMVKRVLYRPERKKFTWDLLNPFSNL